MITELAQLPPEPDADICIVGAGAAGLTLALALEHVCDRVLVLEAGGAEAAPSALPAHVTGFGAASFADSRARGLGGTTTLWAGQAMPLLDLDFAQRPWVAGSGWPMASAEVGRHLPDAERALGLPAAGYDAASWPADQPRPSTAGVPGVVLRYSQFAPVPDLARRHRARLDVSTTITVALGVEVRRIEIGRDGATVVGLHAVDPAAGGRRTVRARRYVICAGGIESCRLMLASLAEPDVTVRFARDLVGRGYGDHAHVHLPVGRSTAAAMAAFTTRRVAGRRLMPKLVASDAWQAEHAALSIGADLARLPVRRSPVAGARRLVAASRARHWGAALAGVGDLVVGAPALARALHGAWRHGHKPSEGLGSPAFVLQCETAPSPHSRITLRGAAPCVHWWVGRSERETVAAFATCVAAVARASDLGAVDLQLPEVDDDEGWMDRVSAGHHHLGGLRMSADPATGIVDPDLRVHGVDNLYVASTAVFPTGGFGNPTLSLLALVARLAATIAGPRGR